jgi:aspartyl-tRNA(Asn)/glutamyl-tRNA(Gln) amidotransferase subunit C
VTLTQDQVRWVAHLARLECSEEELALFTSQLNEIIEHVNQLQAVNVNGVEPLSHPLDLHNVFRPDEPHPSLSAADMLANAPARQGDFYSVPAVLD